MGRGRENDGGFILRALGNPVGEGSPQIPHREYSGPAYFAPSSSSSCFRLVFLSLSIKSLMFEPL